METYNDSDQFAAVAGMLGTIFLIFGVLALILIVSQWKIYTKAGRPGWASLVPIYNIVVMLDIVKKPTWWIILLFIPLVNLVVAIMLIHNLSKAFGQGGGFTLGLLFLSPIFYPLLAFGNYSYIYNDVEPIPAFA